MTGREHLDWCVERAMEYAERGDWSNAWASFISDVRKHSATADIASNQLLAMVMVSGTHDNPRDFRHFISGWAVGS